MDVIAASGWVRHGLAMLAVLVAMPASAAECPLPNMNKGPAKLHFTTAIAPTLYRNDKPRAEMTASAVPSLGTPDIEKSGLTETRTGFEVAPQFEWAKVPGGRACIALREVRAAWRITDMVVDVAAEFRPGSCQYREVRAHEDEHVRINTRAFQEYVPQMEARLKTVVHDIRPMVTEADPEQAMQAMMQRLTAAAKSVQDSYNATMKQRNGAIDTPESYRAVSKRCDKW